MLEVLLLLHRNQPRSFRAVETAAEPGIEQEAAKEQLSALLAIELLTQSEGNLCTGIIPRIQDSQL